ncbi:unnamed protein product [Albugo candida]|uniref:30S ribosomal protein S15 n=1 Tax=Albugo candida TaxID=65357 RepID=A0A024G6B7_9STRA|nr:unnamed protein product [Albugo candida]|eukprot:CCI42375.1 unnamed protein product [Albugo candida]
MIRIRSILSSLPRANANRTQSFPLILEKLSAPYSSTSDFQYVAPPRVSRETTYRFGLKLDDPDQVPAEIRDSPSFSQLKAILSLSNASKRELNQAQVAKAVETFQRFPGDTGSTEVQIAVMTQKVARLTEHVKTHRKDNHSRRGLLILVQKRKKLIKYLRRENLSKFRAVVGALGLRFS